MTTRLTLTRQFVPFGGGARGGLRVVRSSLRARASERASERASVPRATGVRRAHTPSRARSLQLDDGVETEENVSAYLAEHNINEILEVRPNRAAWRGGAVVRARRARPPPRRSPQELFASVLFKQPDQM